MLLNYLVALIVFSIVTVNSMPMSSSVDNGVNGKDLPFCTVCTSVLLDAETIGGVAATQLWVELEVDQRCNHLGIFASQCINAYTPVCQDLIIKIL